MNSNNAIARKGVEHIVGWGKVYPVGLIMSFSAIMMGTIAVYYMNSSSYGLICILPFVFAISNLVFCPNFHTLRQSPVRLILLAGYFVRMAVCPMLFSIGGCKSFFSNCVTQSNVNKAVLLLSLECIIVTLVCTKFTSSNVFNNQPVQISPKKYNYKMLAFIVVLLVSFIAYAYLTIPAISSIYLFLPTANISELANIRWDNETIVARGTISRYIYSLFMFVWPIVRSIIPALAISQIYNKWGYRRKGLFLSTLCVFMPSVLLGGDNIAPFFGALLALLVISRLYGKKARKVYVYVGVIFSIALIVILSAKLNSYQGWRGASGIASVSQILNAYFPGFENMAVTFAINDNNKLSTLFFDLYYAIPFKETLFGLSGNHLRVLFTQVSSTGGQVVPWGAQIAHYLGIVISPLITGVFVHSALKAEQRSNETDSFWRYYSNMFYSVLLAMSVSMYSFSIFFRSIVNVLVPILLVLWISSATKKHRHNIEVKQ